jgi:hypothetical protein
LLLLQARKYFIAHSTGTITTPRAMTGRQKKQGNQFPHSKKLAQEPERNEENRYSDPGSNKMKINYAKEPNEAHKNNLKEEILQVINENFYRDDTGYGQPKCTRDTQEILFVCKNCIYFYRVYFFEQHKGREISNLVFSYPFEIFNFCS